MEETMIDFDDQFDSVVSEITVYPDLPTQQLQRLTSDPAAWRDGSSELRVSKHVDDGCILGTRSDLDLFGEQLGRYFMLKVNAPMGDYIHRTPQGLSIRCRQEIFERMYALFGPSRGNEVATPGTVAENQNPDDEQCDTETASLTRKGAGIALYISQRRSDIQFAAEESARGMAAPHTKT